MKNLSVKDLISFRGKSERSRKTFVNNLRQEQKSSSGSGGDYWVSCISSINNTFKDLNRDHLNEKIEVLQDKIDGIADDRIKTMYQRNIDVLNGFINFEFEDLRPNNELNFHKKPETIITIKDLIISARPHDIFSFSNQGQKEIGALWFVAKLDGFKRNELGMFTDVLYRFLNEYFSKDYSINPKYCLAVDVNKAQSVSYSDLNDGSVPILVDRTLEDVKSIF